MKRTVDLEPDVAAEVRRLEREHGLDRSAAVNMVARRGLATRMDGPLYAHRSVSLGLRVDAADTAALLDLLDAE